jgi:hypothetical protein
MFMMESIDDLWNHIAYTLGCAPDRFPYEDFLEPDQQMTLDRAFDLLRQGVQIAYPEPEFATKRSELNAILDCSYSHYRTGDEIAAGHLLNEFESGIFKSDN